MFLKVRHVQSLNGGGGVIFATGTPIANSMAEMFTMQRYLQPEELKKHGLHHFDSWAATFGEPVTAMELSPAGAGYRLNTRFARFINVPELMQMFRQAADVQTAQMLNLPCPKLENDKPAIRNAPPTPDLKDFVQQLAARADRLKTGRVHPREDNMLKITSEGRKAALDLRLRSAHAEEQYRIRSNLRHAHDDAATFTARLDNLRHDLTTREDTSGDQFSIVLDGETVTNRGIAGELLIRRAEKLKNRVCEEVLVGKFAGFDLFVRTNLGGDADLVLRGKNSYAVRVTDTALGTIRSLEATVQGFEERVTKLETDIADSQKRAKELETKVGAHFEHEERYQDLSRRQSEIEEKLDLTKNQAPSQVEAASVDESEEKNSRTQNKTNAVRPKQRMTVSV